MNLAKTFRLFISSTFSDFRRERQVLQEKVFPIIREYASSKGYVFQPIDLRWGVSNEAQLDQKTLEVCLEEVRNCKNYPHPNFLLMLGDRYGWIPLPYAIEKDEFETIQKNIKDNEILLSIEYNPYKVYDNLDDMTTFHYETKQTRSISKQELLKQWYTLDENTIPSSYIINNRIPKSDYAIYENWEVEERLLCDIFHTAVNDSELTEEAKRKYFISATEAEIEEGIIPYLYHTKYQKELLIKNKTLDEIDSKYIFGFFRNIDKESRKGDKFIGHNYEEAQALKKRVKETDIIQLSKNTTQVDEENLDESYLEIENSKKITESETFEHRIIDFLKKQINEQNNKEKALKLSDLEIEKEDQEYFAREKRNNFYETNSLRTLLDSINEYVGKEDNNQPLLIYGASGSGKSSLMARAIDEQKSKVSKDRKIIYRFVGATPNSSDSKEILISLFSELNKDINVDTEDEFTLSIDNGSYETFEEFSLRVQHLWLNIEEEIIIFIDAVDQLTHSDQFLWLPNNLPSNIKIIISALEDEHYEKDSKFFETLKDKINNQKDNIKKMPKFDEPLNLLKQLLAKDNRTIQKDQEEYFVKQFNTAKSPFYISIAVEEIKHWKSHDYVEDNPLNKSGIKQSLQGTQRGIIEEFINNLSEVYHHDKKFVEKVLGYIYASKDGLSESELLQLLATDQKFIEEVAPEEYHTNHTKELPIVHWSRLHSQLKPFLKYKTQDNEVLMSFFHREFEDAINKLLQVDNTIKLLHKEMSLFYIDMFSEFWSEYRGQIDGKQKIGSIRTYKKLLYHLKKCDDFDSLKYYIGEYLFIYSSIYDVIPIPEKVDYISSFDIDYIKDYLIDRIFELNKKNIKYAGAFEPFEPTIFISRGLYQPLYKLGETFENLKKPNYAIEIYKLTIDKDKQFHNNNYIFIAGHIYSLISIYLQLGDIEKSEQYCNDMLSLKYPIDNQDIYNKTFINAYETVYYKFAKNSLDLILLEKNNPQISYDDYKLEFLDKYDDLLHFDDKELYTFYEGLKNKKYDSLLELVLSKKNSISSKAYNYLWYEFNLRIAFNYIQDSDYSSALVYLLSSEKAYLKEDPPYDNYKSFKLLSSMALCMLKERKLQVGEEYLNRAYDIQSNMQDIDTVYNSVFDLAMIEYQITIGILSTLFELFENIPDSLDDAKNLIDLTIEAIDKNNLYLHPISIEILFLISSILKHYKDIQKALNYVRKALYYAKLVYGEEDEEYLLLKDRVANDFGVL